MAAEIRHIEFSAAEVAAAVREYCREAGWPPLPSGVLRRFELHQGSDGPSATFEVVADDGSRSEPGEVTGGALSEALILYCSTHKIPLPRARTKTLQMFGDSLLLIVTLKHAGKQGRETGR
jgi:hypothetical protein